jgi:transcriptional regulator with XRE-family HTH domain
MKGLPEALRLLRVFHDLNQRELASRLSVSTPYLSQLESAKKTPTIELLCRYSEALNTPLSSILLLAERIETGDFSHTPDVTGGRKVLRILGWLGEQREERLMLHKESAVAKPPIESPRKGAGREDSRPDGRVKKRQRA